MKSKISLVSLLAIAIFVFPQTAFGQFGKLKEKLKEKVEGALDGDDPGRVEKLISKFEKGQPVSTTFDDAIYEADFLGDLEPTESQYLPLDIQPKAEKVGYKLQSGFYTMNARSFCLRGYTHGPSKGDGHLYAPLKGKKADFVQSIIEHYAAKPEVPQQNVQVLLWAIIAGADMNTLGEQHSKTLNSLFTTKELLDLTAKGWADEYVDSQIGEWKKSLLGKTPPKLQELLDADDKIRTMVKGNKSFQEIEKVAIIAGVAPRDMIREVSKGRWSYHPDGYFVRFFPNGYPQTRVDVYVPFKDAVQTDASGKAIGLNADAKESKEVVFNPSGMVASPANRPSQRIGISPIPVQPCTESPSYSNTGIEKKWKAEAEKYLSKDVSPEIRNQPITCAYAKMYLNDPTHFKWAGLAAIVSGKVGESQDDFHWGIGIELKEDVFKGNKAVFDDLFWQHLAFQKGGIKEMERLYCSKTISNEVYFAWQKIAQGDVWEGNQMLLFHEQRNILQNMIYANHSELWWTVDSWAGIVVRLGNSLTSPVPGDPTVFPSGKNIANFDDRWKWIEYEILPSWKSFESNVGNKPILLKALQEACPALIQNEVVAMTTTLQQNISQKTPNAGAVTDEINIGEQIWSGSNLNSTTFRNGDQIHEAKTSEEWESANQERRPAWCYYDNDPSNGAKYGKIYNWYAVTDARGLAPIGWHIPSKDAWNDLFDHLGSNAGIKLKSKTGWNKNGNGDNSSNFNALPGGGAVYGTMYGRNFVSIGVCTNYWTSTEISTESACAVPLCDESKGAGVFAGNNKTSGMYVRCLKGDTYVKKVKKEEKKLEVKPTQPATATPQVAQNGAVMELTSALVDYGTIAKGSDPVRVLIYKSIGTESLVIKDASKVLNARGNDVLVATYPKSSTKPGETGQIEFRFDTNRVGPFYKTITITTNEIDEYGQDKKRTISVKGTVTE